MNNLANYSLVVDVSYSRVSLELWCGEDLVKSWPDSNGEIQVEDVFSTIRYHQGYRSIS